MKYKIIDKMTAAVVDSLECIRKEICFEKIKNITVSCIYGSLRSNIGVKCLKTGQKTCSLNQHRSLCTFVAYPSLWELKVVLVVQQFGKQHIECTLTDISVTNYLFLLHTTVIIERKSTPKIINIKETNKRGGQSMI